MRVAVAGTFGPLHDGHRELFRAALREGDDGVLVALTGDAFANRTRDRAVPSFEDRKAAVEDAVRDLDRWGRDVEIRRLEDEHGIAADDPALDALVVSPETAPELAAINEQRRARGLDPLEGIVVPYVIADDGDRISSTRIARGEIDDHGRVR
ncbi:phosphopantetheine adenylyltransferase [Halobacteriales archaeon QS_1_68_17]|nr:MAG: phosphopantetheine adenylyltransferase [Halobacteriales archaeon QS_1_68_17]